MKTNKFNGYCSLYNVNYYNAFMIMPHAYDNSDTKRVPVLKYDNFNDPSCVIGYAILSTKNNIGAMAMCFLNEDIEIDNIVLDGYSTTDNCIRDPNTMLKQVISGTIRCIILRQKEVCPYHECVTAVKDEENNEN